MVGQYWWNQRGSCIEAPGQVTLRSRWSSTHWPSTPVPPWITQSPTTPPQRLGAGGLAGRAPLGDAQGEAADDRLVEVRRRVDADGVARVGVALGCSADDGRVGLLVRAPVEVRHRLDVQPHDRGLQARLLQARDVELRLPAAELLAADPGGREAGRAADHRVRRHQQVLALGPGDLARQARVGHEAGSVGQPDDDEACRGVGQGQAFGALLRDAHALRALRPADVTAEERSGITRLRDRGDRDRRGRRGGGGRRPTVPVSAREALAVGEGATDVEGEACASAFFESGASGASQPVATSTTRASDGQQRRSRGPSCCAHGLPWLARLRSETKRSAGDWQQTRGGGRIVA